METYGTEEARSLLGEFVERVRVGGEHFVITRYGKPAAVLVNVEWLAETRQKLSADEERPAATGRSWRAASSKNMDGPEG